MPRPTTRVLTLLELLQAGGTRTVTELADRLGVNERTVRRYIDHLIDLDIPVESVRGRHGGYRLTPGYRLPPLMLTDDEALAVLLGLITAQGTGTASETATAKIRRVLPRRLADRLDTLLGTLAFTATARPAAAPDAGVLLTLADAVGHHRPVTIRYTAADGLRSERTLHPHGLVTHNRKWYVTGTDPGIGEERTFRLDRITQATTRPGTFTPPAGHRDPAQDLLTKLATAPHRHHVILRIQGTAPQIHTHLPPGFALVTDSPQDGWSRVELHADHLDQLPPVLAALDLPFAVEQPAELRDLIVALADRLTRSAMRKTTGSLG